MLYKADGISIFLLNLRAKVVYGGHSSICTYLPQFSFKSLHDLAFSFSLSTQGFLGLPLPIFASICPSMMVVMKTSYPIRSDHPLLIPKVFRSVLLSFT